MSKWIKGMMIVVAFVFVLCVCDRIDSRYSVKGSVVEKSGNVILLIDETGEAWEFEEEEEKESFNVNEEVTIQFDNNHTLTRYDDEIKRIKKN